MRITCDAVFSGLGSFSGSFAPASTAPAGGFGGFGFGGFGNNTGATFNFGNIGKAGWGQKGEEEGGDADGGGEDEDAEKEVQVKKSDAVVQLEEVETATGEEDENTAFQVRAKLFMLGNPGEADKDGEEAKTDSADSEKKDAEKKQEQQWVVIGIGNLKINVPKPGSDGLPLCLTFICLPCFDMHARALTFFNDHRSFSRNASSSLAHTLACLCLLTNPSPLMR